MVKASLAVFKQRDFSLLWWGGLISYLGNWMLVVGLPVTVYDLTGSATASASIVASGVTARLISGTFAGVLVDRWDRRRVMVVGNIAQAAVLLPLLLVDSGGDVWICAAVMFAGAAVGPFVNIAEDALLPRLVPDEQLPAANSLNSLNNNLARLVGPMLGGLGVVWFGLGGIAVADAATYLISAALIFAVRGRHVAERAESHRTGVLRKFAGEFADGVRIVSRNRVLLVVCGFFALTSFGDAVFAAVFIVFTERTLGGGADEYAWLIAAQAVGGVLGGVVGGWFATHWSPRRLLGVGALLFASIDLFTFNYPKLWVHVLPGVVSMIIVGVPFVFTYAAAQTLLQRNSVDEFRGRIFAARGTITSACVLLGSGMVVLLDGRVDVVTMLNIQGVFPLLAGVAALVLLPRKDAVREETTAPSPETVTTG
ncbi:MFS transporter [Phytomonospora endophytica]|uniref:MFS family permease n=1 Tax=Phytomonospora endophytica TaxID=714109 RepID=A0A841FF53_9ACTN|nr:MFS transporter [Phytomonospora endophytica]MBB6032192.1 MFS family permease [Phytomonospora endophytica]GIG68541.1 MFS transporter [Phytomonospora endophytica]